MGTGDDNNNTSVADSKPPVPAIRDTLVKTAVEFLQKPQVQKSQSDLKRNFLQSKGLTEQEIHLAFEKAGTASNEISPTNYPPLPVVPHPPLRPLAWPVQQQYTTWQRIRDIANTVTAVGGLIYSLYWLWRKYILPYLFGKKDKPKTIETTISDLESGVQSHMKEIKEELIKGIQQELVTVRTALDLLAMQRPSEIVSQAVTTRLQEVKSEITSLKGLLLNRNQFPPTPVAFPQNGGSRTIPPWQLSEVNSLDGSKGKEEPAEEEAASTGSNSDATTNNGSDSSLEMIKE